MELTLGLIEDGLVDLLFEDLDVVLFLLQLSGKKTVLLLQVLVLLYQFAYLH